MQPRKQQSRLEIAARAVLLRHCSYFPVAFASGGLLTGKACSRCRLLPSCVRFAVAILSKPFVCHVLEAALGCVSQVFFEKHGNLHVPDSGKSRASVHTSPHR